jgi:hypothetical protein
MLVFRGVELTLIKDGREHKEELSSLGSVAEAVLLDDPRKNKTANTAASASPKFRRKQKSEPTKAAIGT